MMHTVNTFATVDAGRQPLASIQNTFHPALPAPAVDKDAVKNVSVDAQEISFHLSPNPSTLHRVLTINRMAGLATVVRRAARTVSLKRVRTINKKAGLEILDRRNASTTPSSSSGASDLKRVRTINKKAGREIVERRKASITPNPSISSNESSTSTLVDSTVSLKRVRTINGKAGLELLQRRKAAKSLEELSIGGRWKNMRVTSSL